MALWLASPEVPMKVIPNVPEGVPRIAKNSVPPHADRSSANRRIAAAGIATPGTCRRAAYATAANDVPTIRTSSRGKGDRGFGGGATPERSVV